MSDDFELFRTDANPPPDGAELVAVTTRDGLRLRAAWWPARTAAGRGTVLILQGRAEFIEKYHEVIGELLQRGFAVATFDWRGQGRSGRTVRDARRGHVRHFDDFRLDLDAVREQLLGPRAEGRLHVLAHSMGGAIAFVGAREGWLGADSLTTLTPMLGLALVKRPRLARGFARLLQAFGLGSQFVPGAQTVSISTLPFDGNRLCSDKVRYDRNAAVAAALGSAAIGSPTIGWVVAAYELMDRVAAPGFAAAIDLPVLLLVAGADPVCSTPTAELFGQSLRRGRVVLVPGARHEILHEADAMRAIFWEAFDRFVGTCEGQAETLAEPRIELATAGA